MPEPVANQFKNYTFTALKRSDIKILHNAVIQFMDLQSYG
jgi:hypothetical protein